MADLHKALQHLSPVNWQDVPVDNLQEYLTECFNAGEIIVNSVPPPAPPAQETPFEDLKPHFSHPNAAKTSRDIHASAIRPQYADPDHAELQKSWGKPMKFKEKDNPLDVQVYKMAGKDRHGAWFSRSSIHEGIGFSKFKQAMMSEFATSLEVEGGPGAGAIRGLAADRRIEEHVVENTGKLEVFELSAQFPGPTTAREFNTLLLTSDNCLTDESAVLVDGKSRVPRHFMVVSRPVDHPDAPERSGYVRGHYESVELIREIPITKAKSKSTPNLLSQVAEASDGKEQKSERSPTLHKTLSSEDTSDKAEPVIHKSESGNIAPVLDDAELNPVEWIMITRSDPGGGIPRFLVDRGTPEAMLQDINKLYDWACKGSDEGPAAPPDRESAEKAAADSEAGPPTADDRTSANPGILSNLTAAIGAGVEAYTPAVVSSMVHRGLHPFGQHDEDDDTSDTASVDSFMSAEELKRATTASEHLDSADSLSLAGSEMSTASKPRAEMSHHEKEVLKLTQKREKLEQQLAKKRIAEQEKLRQAQEKEEGEASKQKEKIEKEIQKMEEKHRKELEKIEQKKEKEARKAEEKRLKRDEQSKISAVTRERDDFRSQADLYKKENKVLRDQVAALQAQIDAMAEKLTRLTEVPTEKSSASIKSGISQASVDPNLKTIDSAA